MKIIQLFYVGNIIYKCKKYSLTVSSVIKLNSQVLCKINCNNFDSLNFLIDLIINQGLTDLHD
jgi:hypothetical protein